MCFLTGFWTKKEQNVRFQTDFKEKTLIIEQQLSQNVTGFIARYSVFLYLVFGQKRTKREISDRFSMKSPYNRTTIFSKRNGVL